ncbi:MAG: Sec-independent protein translocase protein TatB [Acidimicrobiia bacterium]
MFNVGTPELLVILLVALLVLGPNKLPEAARQVGRAMGELRRLSSGFQAELRDAIQEPVTSRPPPSTPAVVEGTLAGDGVVGGTVVVPDPDPADDTSAVGSGADAGPTDAAASRAGDVPAGDPPGPPAPEDEAPQA